jgi:hypothetical protein
MVGINAGRIPSIPQRSSIPNPNRAKSYLTGSAGQILCRRSVSSRAVCQSVCLRVMSLSLRATRSTCRSQGQIRSAGFSLFQIPKSTPLSSFRTIQRKNIFSRLQVDFCEGEDTCFFVRCGKSGREKKQERKWLRAASAANVKGSFSKIPVPLSGGY